MSWDLDEIRRRVEKAGLVADNVPVYRLAEIDTDIRSKEYMLGLLAIDCPDCGALVRLGSYVDHDQWHRGGWR